MKRRILVASVTAVTLCAFAALAQTPAVAPPPKKPPSVYADYRPSFSDMMTTAVQPRHIKLGLALRARNWTYAAYALGELRGAFNRIARSIPSYEGKDTAEFITLIAPQLDTLQMTIKAKDAKAAATAYADLTTTCNTCHVADDRAYIVIRAPAASDYPDQDFDAR